MLYIDLNMVRAGVVSHPSEWAFCRYNEILSPRKKNVLIDHEKLMELTGFESYNALCATYQELVVESLANASNNRQSQWIESVAVGSKSFLEDIKVKLGVLAKGREVVGGDSFQLREEAGTYNSVFEGKKDDIGPLNTYFWDVISRISGGLAWPDLDSNMFDNHASAIAWVHLPKVQFHDGVLDLAVRGGIVAVILLATSIILFIKNIGRNSHELTAISVSFITASLVYNLTEVTFLATRNIVWIIFLALIFMFTLARRNKQGNFQG